MSKELVNREAIHQLAFELGGTEGGEYWLDANDLDKLIAAALDEVALLNQPASAGAVDERAAFEAWYETTYGISLEPEFRSNHFIGYVNDKANHRWTAWKVRAALTARAPNHGEQVGDVSAMARVLSDRQADACNVDRDDQWKIYGQDFIEDVTAMLAAAPSAGSQGGDV